MWGQRKDDDSAVELVKDVGNFPFRNRHKRPSSASGRATKILQEYHRHFIGRVREISALIILANECENVVRFHSAWDGSLCTDGVKERKVMSAQVNLGNPNDFGQHGGS